MSRNCKSEFGRAASHFTAGEFEMIFVLKVSVSENTFHMLHKTGPRVNKSLKRSSLLPLLFFLVPDQRSDSSAAFQAKVERPGQQE